MSNNAMVATLVDIKLMSSSLQTNMSQLFSANTTVIILQMIRLLMCLTEY